MVYLPFTWDRMPNFNHCLTAHKPNERTIGYYRPGHLEGLTAVHRRIAFEHAVVGSLIVGAGRKSMVSKEGGPTIGPGGPPYWSLMIFNDGHRPSVTACATGVAALGVSGY